MKIFKNRETRTTMRNFETDVSRKLGTTRGLFCVIICTVIIIPSKKQAVAERLTAYFYCLRGGITIVLSTKEPKLIIKKGDQIMKETDYQSLQTVLVKTAFSSF